MTKSLLGLSAASIIAASCSNDGLWEQDDQGLESLMAFSDEGETALSISLSQEDVEYLNFINALAQDIIKQPAVARQFIKDPDAFVEQYGYKGEVSLDEGMLRLILALGDEDINTAINKNDISTVLSLMQTKGILDDVSKYDVSIKLSSSEIQKIYAEMGIQIDDSLLSRQDIVTQISTVYVIVIAISQLGVAYNVVAGINAAIALNVYLTIEAWGLSSSSNNVISTNLPLKIWSLKGQNANSYIAADQYVSDLSKQIMTIVKEKNPFLLDYISEAELEQVIKLNLINSSKK